MHTILFDAWSQIFQFTGMLRQATSRNFDEVLTTWWTTGTLSSSVLTEKYNSAFDSPCLSPTEKFIKLEPTDLLYLVQFYLASYCSLY